MSEQDEEFEEYLVINWISIERYEILVGATDNFRWDMEIEDGATGGDARSCVWVKLVDPGKGWATQEQAEFLCAPGDPDRKLAMSHLYELFEIAWKIQQDELDYDEAVEQFFGMEIGREQT